VTAAILGVSLLQGCANHTLAVLQENDSLSPQPSGITNYSNGMQITLSPSAPVDACGDDCDPRRLHRLIDRVNILRAGSAGAATDTWLRYGIGHKFFTPDDVTLSTLQEDDRPYAGWLFASLDIVNETDTTLADVRGRHYRNTVGLRAGIVGPSAQGDALQKFWHGVCGCDEPQGWHLQLRDEPGLIFRIGHERKLLRRGTPGGFRFELIGSAEAAAGNIYTGAELGGTLRLGWRFNPGWSAISIDDVAYDDSRVVAPFGAFVFASATGRYVARDIFVDGNTWTHSHSVERRPFVTDQALGVGFHRGRLEVRAGFVRRSLQYETQPQPTRFGSVAFILRPRPRP
jgi:hypothetical protein